jgi:hypothetical protein
MRTLNANLDPLTEELLKTYDVLMIGYFDQNTGNFSILPSEEYNEDAIILDP